MHALAALWQNPRGRLVVIGVGLIALFIAIRYAAQRGIGATSPIALPGTDTTGTTTGGTTGGTTTGGTTDGTTAGTTAGSTDGGAFTSPYLPYVPGAPGGTFVPTGPGVNLSGSDAATAPSERAARVHVFGTGKTAVFDPFPFFPDFGVITRGGTPAQKVAAAASAGAFNFGVATSESGNITAGALNTPVLGGLAQFLGGGLKQSQDLTRALNPYGPRGAAQATAGGAGPSAGGYSSIAANQLAHRGQPVPASFSQAVAPPHPNVSFAGLYRTAGLDV